MLSVKIDEHVCIDFNDWIACLKVQCILNEAGNPLLSFFNVLWHSFMQHYIYVIGRFYLLLKILYRIL